MTAPVRVVSSADNGEVPGALLDRLRRRAEAVRESRTLDKPVPGFEGLLVLRFKPLQLGELERFLDNRRNGRVSEISEGIDALAMCCVGVFGRDGEHLHPIADRIDYRLAELLGMDFPPDVKPTAREVVTAMFGGEAFALGNFVDGVVEWMSDPDGNGQPEGKL